MEVQNYAAFAAATIRLTQAANLVFEREVRVKSEWQDAVVTNVEFHPHHCLVTYRHCSIDVCNEYEELRIKVKKLLAVAAGMDESAVSKS